jgi:hypothetical protein
LRAAAGTHGTGKTREITGPRLWIVAMIVEGVSEGGRGMLVLWWYAFQARLCNLAPDKSREGLDIF